MHFTPRPYQDLIIGHQLDVRRGAAWAGMGLGKTVSALTGLDLLSLTGDAYPALVLAPLRVAQSTWPDEVEKWDHLRGMRVVPIVGTAAERTAALHRRGEVFTCNYENIPWLLEQLAPRWPFKTVIPDESTKLKGFRLKQGTKRAQALAKIASKTLNWFNLTGTPSPNGYIDLWGQTWFLDHGARLGRTFTAFRDRWFRADPYTGALEILPCAEAEIQSLLADICMTIRAEDWFDLRAPVVNAVEVELPAKVREQYRKMERELYATLAGEGVEALNGSAKRNILRQIASGAVYVDEQGEWSATDEYGVPTKRTRRWVEVHDLKLQALDEVIEEAAGSPLLVAYHFIHSRERILKSFKQARVLDHNPQTIRDWNAGKIPVLVLHPKSAGHGLNLQDGGHRLAFFDEDDNLEEHDQVIERIGPTRQLQAGYDRAVFLTSIVARQTVDEQIRLRLITKRSVQDILLEAMRRTA